MDIDGDFIGFKETVFTVVVVVVDWVFWLFVLWVWSLFMLFLLFAIYVDLFVVITLSNLSVIFFVFLVSRCSTISSPFLPAISKLTLFLAILFISAIFIPTFFLTLLQIINNALIFMIESHILFWQSFQFILFTLILIHNFNVGTLRWYQHTFLRMVKLSFETMLVDDHLFWLWEFNCVI